MKRREKSRSGRGNSMCKGPKAGQTLTFWRNSLAVSGFGRKQARRQVLRGLKRPVHADLKDLGLYLKGAAEPLNGFQ